MLGILKSIQTKITYLAKNKCIDNSIKLEKLRDIRDSILDSLN